MIDADAAEKAVDWLRANARSMAQARAERLYLEQWVKSVKAAQLIKLSVPGRAVIANEAVAITSPEYMAALQAYKAAVEADEYNRFMLTAAEAKIEAWRSQESTRRAEGKAY
jgi:hypothetical protein